MDRLQEIKAVFKQWCEGKGGELENEDIEWLIKQAEKVKEITESNIELRLEVKRLSELQKKTAENLVECRVKIKKIKDVVHAHFE